MTNPNHTDTSRRDDLVERLRSVDISWSETGELCAEAADLIEQHKAFRQEVSDAVEAVKSLWDARDWPSNDKFEALSRFIIPKSDPLVEVIADYKRTKGTGEYATNKDMADALRAALAARGLEIREKQP